ncbi:MAG: SAM-dependent chlorinase/fluorinase [Chitinophagales bacterium]
MKLPIALLTDFGNKDWYVPVMKSVIYSINPNVPIIDISHEVFSHGVDDAAFVLWNAHRYFPQKTVFCVVIDPGVGTLRKIIAVETEKHILVAPDNGVLDIVLSESKIIQMTEVKNVKFFLDEVSATFHGRDVFAPVAAHISKGEELRSFGDNISIPEYQSPFYRINAAENGHYLGKIIYIDKFGNLISNFMIKGKANGRVILNDIIIPQISNTFSDVEIGQVLAYVGSSGFLEIAIRNGSAKQILGLSYLDGIELTIT